MTLKCPREQGNTSALEACSVQRRYALQKPMTICKWFHLRDIKIKIKIMKHKLTFNVQKMRMFTTAHKYL
jgi:hypothetical protein